MRKKRKEHFSIYKRLIQVSIYRVSMPLILLALLIMFVSTFYVIVLTYDRSEDIISSIESSTSIFLGSYLNSLDEIYHSQYQIDQSVPVFNSRLKAYNESNPEIESIWFLDVSGKAVAGTNLLPSEVGRDFSGHDYFKDLKKTGDIYWSDVFISQGENRPIVTVAKKYEDIIVVLRVSLAKLTDALHVFNISERSYIAVTDSTGAYIAHSDVTFVNTRAYDPNRLDLIEEKSKHVRYENRNMLAFYRVIRDTQWGIIFYQSIYDILLPIFMTASVGFIIIAGLGFVSLKAVYKLNSEIAGELEELIGWTKRVAKGAYSSSISERSFDEFNKLSESYGVMMEEIIQREKALEVSQEALERVNENLEHIVEARTNELEKSLEELKSTQNQLIQKEKMASLGSLVTGVAHELNTPIGISMTAATYVDKLSKEIDSKMRSGDLSKKEFDSFMDNVVESTKIIERNMTRASELIQSFKRISINQEKMDRQKINLQEIIDATFISYSGELKKHNVETALEYVGDMECVTYPGAISQILTNLIQNSLKHAFGGVASPKIYLKCSEDKSGTQMHLLYSDNGKGIIMENINRIFDPFFTTVMGQGSSGLGLNIVYNLVTSLLNGEIKYINDPEKGASFEIIFPKRV